MNQSEIFIRKPAVAGPRGFYPSDPATLKEAINEYLSGAQKVSESKPLGLIAPHAGYVYSGPVAGWAYRQLAGWKYDTVVVLAPSHSEFFSFASIMAQGRYQTPLGDIEVDGKFGERLAQASGGAAQLSLEGHHAPTGVREEHSLEVQLPFLQVVLGDFKLVPVVIGAIGWDLCRNLGLALAEVGRGSDVLIVASSDLSHYHGYDEACRLDSQVIRRIEQLDAQGLAEGCRSRKLEACGGVPIAALMVAAEQAGAGEVRILRHATSGDIPAGERDYVVGYLAAAFYRSAKV